MDCNSLYSFKPITLLRMMKYECESVWWTSFMHIKESLWDCRLLCWLVNSLHHFLKDHSAFIFRVKQSIKYFLVAAYQSTPCNIPEDWSHQRNLHESPASCKFCKYIHSTPLHLVSRSCSKIRWMLAVLVYSSYIYDTKQMHIGK